MFHSLIITTNENSVFACLHIIATLTEEVLKKESLWQINDKMLFALHCYALRTNFITASGVTVNPTTNATHFEVNSL